MDCFFGTALTSAKNGFSEDVVRSIVILNKISYATQVETTYDQSLPTSCDVLLKPNVPVPYPYESYPYEHYQPEPYHRNTYQRNPYQRNPYQRNPYQRNPYRRNSYQRNPYKHRN
ncbi:hypothetical protein AAVH_22815 [Aphelenchoides avenae]|nr:hypothetical protein AAVH_22815 [Aphelenchus avenae]